MDRTGIGLLVVCLFSASSCVFGQTPVNIALGKTYRQISTYNSQGPSSNAANGNTSGVYSPSNCIHTDAGPTGYPSPYRYSWWEVDLGRVYPIYNITVWARETFNRRLYPFTITVDGQQCVHVSESEAPPGGVREKHVTCSTVMYGRVVRLTLQRYDQMLNLCEFQIFVPACPPTGPTLSTGTNCDQSCTGVSQGCTMCTTGNLCAQCKPWLGGPDCTDCGPGYHKDSGNACVACSPNCDSRGCDRDDGNCYGCNVGYHGDQCQDECSTITNNGHCTECRQDGTCTACSGHFVPPACTKCQNGFYKTSNGACVACSQTCDYRGCDRDNGRCHGCTGNFDGNTCTECVPGYFGSGCTQQCDSHCTDSGCDRNSGHCFACDDGYWGNQFCRQPCPSNCYGGTCRRDNGYCSNCRTGYYGDQCQRTCDQITPGCWGCTKQGVCTVCKQGYTSPPCTECADTYYKFGNECKPCAGNCKNGRCEDSTGKCEGCRNGYHGDQCSSHCSSLKNDFYTQCSQCTQDSTCTACTNNFQAPDCTDCVEGYYKSGSSCYPCSSLCKDRKCDRFSGRCNGCVDGRYRDKCWGFCPSGCARCDQDSGDCTACKANSHLISPGCTECEDGYYKTSPSQSCTRCRGTCYNNTPCNKTTGHCAQCPPGRKGDVCSQPCDHQTYGFRCRERCGQCRGVSTCGAENGTCPLCHLGFYPPLCQDACRDKTYGENCSESCGPCKGGQPCDTKTGECTEGCQPGYTTALCNKHCEAGSYGEGCNQTCANCLANTTCHHETGHCLVGCRDGFVGPLCSQAAQSGTNSGAVGGAVGGVIAAILVIVAVVVVVLFLRRRKRREKPPVPRSGGSEMSSSVNPLTSDTDTSRSPLTATSLSSAPVVIPPASGAAEDKPKAEVKPTVKPKPGQPAKTNGAIYENVGILAQKPEAKAASQSKSADAKTSPKVNGVKNDKPARKGKPPIAAKPTKGKALRAGDETPPDPLTEDEDEDFKMSDAVYANEDVYANIRPTGIRVDKLQQIVVERLGDGSLDEEFKRMIPNKDFPLKNGQRDENYYKNRFNSILPYDKNRVELTQVDGDDASDYVNASFVRGYRFDKAYIASQGARVNTVDDFWRMVWETGVTHIVMLTNVKEGNKPKCYEYWPAQGDRLTTGHMEVTGVEEDTRAHFVIRTFDLKQAQGSSSRRVKQYHYQSWMDHEVPATTPLVNFWRYVRSRAPRTAEAPPLLVHCSAGVGRTGTFIALDIIYDHAQQEAEIDIYKTVDRLRDDRCHMVQNKGQYSFLHEAVLEAYLSGDSRLQVSDMDTVLPHKLSHRTPHHRIDTEFETLCKLRNCLTTPSYTTANQPENRAKNRNPDALPNDKNLVYLTQHVKGRNQYINAVYMSTFLQQRGAIMTQLPLPDTLVDFWRLVDGCDVNTIVGIGDVEGKKDMCRYWPKDSKSTVRAGAYTISFKALTRKGDSLDSFTVEMKKDGKSREVKVWHYTNWNREAADNTEDLVQLLNSMHKSHEDRGGKPVVVQCIDGASQSGVVCALWDVISRMTCDAELDVYMAVRQLHTVRPEAITSREQYRYCYEVAQHFKNSQNVYANT